jgi:tRNA(Ile)-lysidine synthase
MAESNRLNPDQISGAVHERLPDGPLIVALGGGADSAVAAWAVSKHAKTRGVFVRHALIGSERLERAALDLGNAVGIDVTVIEAPVTEGPSLEDRARRLRWRAIEEEADDTETIVTGHTRDDQAETVLMNLLRGSGNAGVAGMLRSRPGVVRPLMGISRADLRAIAEDLSLPFADDPSNEDPGHLRNRIRRDLLPDLERDYRTGIRTVLARTGALAAADDQMIEDLAAVIPVLDDDGAVLIPSAPLATAHRSVASRVVRRALRRLLDPYAGSAADVEAVLRLAELRVGSVMLTNALVATREGPCISIGFGRPVRPQPETVYVPSSIDFGGTLISFAHVGGLPVRPRSTLLVDPSVLALDAVVRCSDEGDRIEIEAGSKTIRDVLAEHEVPVRQRSTWPVVESSGRISVAVGIRVAPWARPTTNEAVAITRERGRS